MLDAHVQRKHVGLSDEHACECRECGKRYVNKYALKKHVENVHTVERLKCTECGKKFKNKSKLYFHNYNVHADKSTPTEDLRCKVCEMSFRFKFKLEAHALTAHPGVCTFECTDCGATFERIWQLRYHKETVHWKRLNGVAETVVKVEDTTSDVSGALNESANEAARIAMEVLYWAVLVIHPVRNEHREILVFKLCCCVCNMYAIQYNIAGPLLEPHKAFGTPFFSPNLSYNISRALLM